MKKVNCLLTLIFTFFSLTAYAEDDQTLPAGIMAKRGQGIVTPIEFDARVSKIPEDKRTIILRDASKVRTMLGNLLLTSQLVADAKEEGFDQGDELLVLRMKMAAQQELANAWLEHIAYTAPDADYTALAKEYYLLNKDEFDSGPRVDVTHLLVSTKERTVEEAELLAQSYLDKTLSDPSSFDELVITYSEDPSVQSNSGKFTDVKRNVMVKPFEQAAFGLKNAGDFSGLVETQYGFHIIRLDQAYPSTTASFEEVRMQLELKMKQNHLERTREDYLRSLTSMPTDISDEEIRSMILRYFNADEIQIQPNPSDSE